MDFFAVWDGSRGIIGSLLFVADGRGVLSRFVVLPRHGRECTRR